jgi:hypothetical protein
VTAEQAEPWRRAAWTSLLAGLWPLLVNRAIVLVSLELARFLVTDTKVRSAKAVAAAHAGLLGWDAAWYRRIAEDGYGAAGKASLRFFPLLPLVARGLGRLPGVSIGAGLLIVATLGSWASLALVHRLVLHETRSSSQALFATWIIAVAPAAFVLVMGYAEAPFIALAAATFLLIRTRRFAWAVLPAFLAGLCRPAGLLLALPVLVEGLRGLRDLDVRGWAARALAVLAAPAGAVAYLAWAEPVSGSFLEPLRQQLSPRHRGGIADPIVTLAHDASDLVHRVHLGTALHAPVAVVLVALAVVAFVKWPASYGSYAAITLAVALSAPNLDSLERYALACFPFALALSSLATRREVRWAVLAGSGALLVSLSVLAFLGAYVP